MSEAINIKTLKGFVIIKGKIEVLSGLHIGAGKETMEIGGLDQPIIKHPLTGEPYIPGSSLKGRMRALLEQVVAIRREETLKDLAKGNPCHCGKSECYICKLFGVSGAADNENGPTRLLVRDCRMTEEWKERFRQGELPMEVKFENKINRVTGVAEHPRPLERVPAGVEFDMELVLRVYEDDEPKKMLDYVAKGLKLISLDALGGNGSRGCGQVRFKDLKVESTGNIGEKLEMNLKSVSIP